VILGFSPKHGEEEEEEEEEGTEGMGEYIARYRSMAAAAKQQAASAFSVFLLRGRTQLWS
jgi:hypothetical protein